MSSEIQFNAESRAQMQTPSAGHEELQSEKNADLFRMHVTKDRMRVLVDCDTTGNDLQMLAEAMLSRLLRFGVRRPPQVPQIVSWLLDQTRDAPSFEDRTLVQGTPPVPPVDGHIEWAGDFFNPGFLVDEETGRVNFRKRAAERNVKAEQRLATIAEPVPGKNGMDITGEVIRVRKPRSARVRVGQNVRFDEPTLSYFATITGRFRFANDFLAVDELYEIDGDVGLETGDVSHQGAVLVHGDVLEGARLEALGDIEVEGIVDGSHVQTSGMLKVHGGITGREDTIVIAAGGIHAKYILDATVQSNGDIVVEKEIMHANIATLGALLVPQGRIVGGQIVALGGVDAGQIGSAGSTPTNVVAGEDYSLEGQLLILRNRLQKQNENIAKVKAVLSGTRGKVATMAESSKDALRKLLKNLPAMERSRMETREEIEVLRSASRENARHIILIRRQLYPEARLTIKGATLHVRDEVSGPVRPALVDDAVRLATTRIRSIKNFGAWGQGLRQESPDWDNEPEDS